MQLVSLLLIQWIAIHPVDSAIHRLNNWGLVSFQIIKDTSLQVLVPE